MTKSLTEQEALKYVLDALHRHSIGETYDQLKFNFPEFEPSVLFRTLVHQQCWVDICNNNLNDAIIHTQELGESPGQNFYQMWRQTTRNKARQTLYEYLHKQSLLSEKDEENYSILLKLINTSNQETPQPKKQKSFFSFTQKSKNEAQSNSQDADAISQNQQNIMKAFCDTLKSLTENNSEIEFEKDVPMTGSFDENKIMIFPDLFSKLIPKEEPSKSFVGNIIFIESQPPKILKYLKTKEGSIVERLWVLHCEQKIPEMQQIFNEDISNFKAHNPDLNSSPKTKKIFQFQYNDSNKNQTAKRKKPKSLKFCDLYYNQMNEYEKESLFDILAVNCFFCECELNSIEKLLYRICKNKLLFDQNWWSRVSTTNFQLFIKNFAQFCSLHNLYLPFEIFVLNHPKAKEIDLSKDLLFEKQPLIRFIWDLWVKREPFSASISNFQLNSESKANATEYEELWKDLPEGSLSPLSLFIWNKDSRRFLPNSSESNLLSEKLKAKFPLLSDLVRGKTPHPASTSYEVPKNEKNWRFLLYTSKNDLEVHELIESHFTQYDFTKVFTSYYGDDNFKGQPSFPHFDHPELISSPSDPPYLYYVKSMLPVSAFQQAINDKVSDDQFKDLCLKCMREALLDKSIRLSCLTFIELTDFKLKTDFSVDFKLSVSIFDRLTTLYEHSPFDLNSLLAIETPDPFSLVGATVSNFMGNEASNNSTALNELIISELSKVFVSKSQESAKFLQQRLHPTNVDVLLLSLLLGIRCSLPPDYGVIDVLASKMHPAELILFIDRAEEIGCKYDMKEVASIIRQKMPNNSLKEPILFLLTQELPSIYSTNTTTTATSSSSNTKEDEELVDMEMEPALVVFNALHRKEELPYISLLEEALVRRDSFYSIIASMVDGSDSSMCALVTLMTMTDAFSFNVSSPPDIETRSRLFLEVIDRLLMDGKSDDVLKTIELFSKDSIILPIVNFYDSVFIFAFKRAQLSFTRFHELIKKCQNNGKNINDDLLGQILVDDILNMLFPLQEELAKHCASKSQIHLFRYLQLLDEEDSMSFVSPFLRSRVKLANVIAKFDDFRKSLLHCNLIDDKEKVVNDLILNHSLSLGESAALCFELQPSKFINEWIESQFLAASTPYDVIKTYSRVTEMLMHPDTLNEAENLNEFNECSDDDDDDQNDDDENLVKKYVDPLFFVSLFAAMVQFVLPSSICHFLEFAYKMIKSEKGEENSKGKEPFLVGLKSLILNIKILNEHSIDSAVLIQNRSTNEVSSCETVAAILEILFPQKYNDEDYNSFVKSIPTKVPLNFTSNVTYTVDSIRLLFKTTIDQTIDICIEDRGLDEARMLSSWMNKNSQTIEYLESIEILFDVFNSKSSSIVHIIDDENEVEKPPLCFTSKQKEILVSNGFKSSKFKEKTMDSFFIDTVEAKELQDVLNSMILKNNHLFSIISLHFQSSAILRSYADSDPEYKAKSSPLIRPCLVIGKSSKERTIQLLQSPLPMMVNHIDLTRNLIKTESIQSDLVSNFLTSNFIQTVVHQKEKKDNNISFVLVDDFGDKFKEFASLCGDSHTVGNILLGYANRQINNDLNEKDVKITEEEKKVEILTNILLHASLCSTRIEECSDLLNKLCVDIKKSNKNEEDVRRQVLKIVTVFPEPSLMTSFIEYLLDLCEDDVDSLFQGTEISSNLCIEILNAAKNRKKFQPEKFFNITLSCKLYYEHAKLQSESANNLLSHIISCNESESDVDLTDSSVSESGSEELPADASGAGQQDKRELKRLKKIEKQKQKEEKIELRKLKRKEKLTKSLTSINVNNKQEILQESSRRFLLALAYSLHEKCYFLSIECLKKLSLISLQRELSNSNSISNSSSNLIASQNDKNLNVFGLSENDVLMLMKTREFPFALTIAISYDMDNEINWSRSIFAQSIEKQGDDFLAAFLYFKPMTSNLWNGVVDRYKEYFEAKERINVNLDKEIMERMKLFLMKIPNLVERYRLFKKLKFKDLAENMREKHPVICEWCDKVI